MNRYLLFVLGILGSGFFFYSFGEEFFSTHENGDGLNIYWEVQPDQEISGGWKISLRFENSNRYPIKVSYEGIVFTFSKENTDTQGSSTFSIPAESNIYEKKYCFYCPVSLEFRSLFVTIPITI